MRAGLKEVSWPQAGLAASFISGLAGAQGAVRGPARGHSLKEGVGGKGSSFPVGAKELQEEGEDVNDV